MRDAYLGTANLLAWEKFVVSSTLTRIARVPLTTISPWSMLSRDEDPNGTEPKDLVPLLDLDCIACEASATVHCLWKNSAPLMKENLTSSQKRATRAAILDCDHRLYKSMSEETGVD